MKLRVLNTVSLLVVGLSISFSSHAQRPSRGGGSGGGRVSPGSYGGGGGGRVVTGGGPVRGGYTPRPTRVEPSRVNNGGYRPNNGGYRPSAPDYRSRTPVMVRRYDSRQNAGYVGNRVVYRDRFDQGRRVRTFYGYNNRVRECYYTPARVFGLNLYVYHSRFDVRYYSRFPVSYSMGYQNTWFYANDPWYYRYQYYYAYNPVYTYPSQWLLDYYYRNLLREYQQEVAEQQAVIDYQNQIIQSRMQPQTRAQLESQVQQRMSRTQMSISDSLRDSSHLYVVSDEVNVLTQTGERCSITRGDVLKVANGGYFDGSATASLQVVSAKDESCDVGSIVTLSVDQLQEFENSMAADIDDGLDEMSRDPQLRSTLRP